MGQIANVKEVVGCERIMRIMIFPFPTALQKNISTFKLMYLLFLFYMYCIQLYAIFFLFKLSCEYCFLTLEATVSSKQKNYCLPAQHQTDRQTQATD